LKIGNPSETAENISGDITFSLPLCSPNSDITVTSSAGQSLVQLKSGQQASIPLELSLAPQQIETFTLTGSATGCADDPSLPDGIRVTVTTK
jgi:hypothetical protein